MLTYEDEIEKQYCRFDLNFAPTDPTRTRIVGKMRERTRCRDHAVAYGDHAVAYQFDVQIKMRRKYKRVTIL